MSGIVYRNKQGELKDLPVVTATRLKTDFGDIFERALVDGAVAITRHGQQKAVLISFSEFEALTQLRSSSLDALTSEFNDDLLARMQTPAAKKAMSRAFDATTAQLGAAAIRAAKRRR